jgi:hypothetical protein
MLETSLTEEIPPISEEILGQTFFFSSFSLKKILSLVIEIQMFEG